MIVPPLTMASTSLAVLHQRAVPVFADIDPDTFLIDPESIRDRITPRTRAIITVALYGLSPDMDPIMELAQEHGIAVIEDDAQCFLGRYKGRIAGSIGDLASFSFQNSKHITCGEGGMVTTNNHEYADRVARFASLGYGLVSRRGGEVEDRQAGDRASQLQAARQLRLQLPHVGAVRRRGAGPSWSDSRSSSPGGSGPPRRSTRSSAPAPG